MSKENQIHKCLSCSNITIHKSIGGDRTGRYKLPTTILQDEIVVYRRTKQCVVCGGTQDTYEITEHDLEDYGIDKLANGAKCGAEDLFDKITKIHTGDSDG